MSTTPTSGIEPDKSNYMDSLIKIMIQRNYWEKLVTNEILTSPRHEYLYTAVSKTACTQVKFILADLERYPDKLDRNLAPHYVGNSGLIPVAEIKNRNHSYNLFFNDDIFKFTFIRNPLTRLASVFKNKLQLNFYAQWEQNKIGHLTDNYTNLAARIKSEISGVPVEKVDLIKAPLTFREFVIYIYNQKYYEMDRHWYPQNMALFIDIIKYHYYGRVEHFNDAIKKILHQLKAPEDLYDYQEKQNAALKKITVSDFYDAELEKMAVRIYEKDFDLFGYPRFQVRTFSSRYN